MPVHSYFYLAQVYKCCFMHILFTFLLDLEVILELILISDLLLMECKKGLTAIFLILFLFQGCKKGLMTQDEYDAFIKKESDETL